jgi:hypothetical protein
MLHRKMFDARLSAGCMVFADFIRPSLLLSLLFLFGTLRGQSASDTALLRILTDRSAKIVSGLGLRDTEREGAVTRILVAQYLSVNEIHARFKPAPKPQGLDSLSRVAWEADRQRISEQKARALQVLHASFLGAMSDRLDAAGVEAVKDAMTYRVMPITYAAYLDMLPGLTEAQRVRIMEWLREARELAMDEGSSNAKHAVFGKYKGRINNYLSAQGYDLKKETEAWQQRIKERNLTK